VDFNSHTDAVVAVTVELINALTSGERRGRPYNAPQGIDKNVAVTTALSAGRRGSRTVTDAEARGITEVAHELRGVFQAITDDDVDDAAARINAVLERTQARPLLKRHDDEPWHLHYHGAGDTFTNNWAAGCATGLAVVLGSEHADRLGVCTAPSCDRVYVDVSRNGTRRFCSTSCQNRVKAAAFRAREKSAPRA
jgi:predicted RNA-binding Zn ribbon-like protein